MEEYKTGDKPGKGDYKCMRCGKVITLDSDDAELPACPRCHGKRWKKL